MAPRGPYGLGMICASRAPSGADGTGDPGSTGVTGSWYDRIETSSMPSYLDRLSEQELEDLVAYLYGLIRSEG